MNEKKEKYDLPRKKSPFLRRLFFIVFFLFIVIPFAVFAVVIRGGSFANDAVSGTAEKYFSHFDHLSVNFENLSGNLFEGYTLEGLSVGDKTTSDIVVAEKIFLEPDVWESWAQRKIVLRGTVDGLRMKESKMNDLLLAVKEDFHLGTDTGSFAPFSLVVPKNFSGKDWSGESGWEIAEISFNYDEPEKLVYKFSLDAEYQKEPIRLVGTTEVSEAGMPLWAELRLLALESDIIARMSVKDDRITVENIGGRVLNSPLQGSASIDFAQNDPEISADLSLGSLDLSPLRKLFPELGPTTVENLRAQIRGTLAHPSGEFSLKNGELAWLAYKFSNLQANAISDGKKLNINFSGSALGSAIEASGNLGLTADSPLALEASITSLQLREIEHLFPELKSAELEGVAFAKITASGTLAQPNAQISVRSPKIFLRKKSVFSDVGATIFASRSKLSLRNFSAESGGGKIFASGALILGESSPSLALQGNLDQFDLSAFGDVVGKMDGIFSVGGTVDRPQINLEAKIPSLDVARFGVKDITLSARGGDVLDVHLRGLTKMNTHFGGGGKITLRGARSAMDLKFNLDRLKLTELFPHTMKFSGEISMSLLLGGTFDNPDVSATVWGTEILAAGYKIAYPHLKALLNGRKIDIDASLAVGDRRPSVKGTIDFENGFINVGNVSASDVGKSAEISAPYFKKGFKCVLDIAAPDVRIDFLAPSLAGKVYGRVTMKSRALISEKDVEISGSVSSPMLGVSGIHATDIIVPFTFKNEKLEVSDGILTLGDGPVNFKADGDTGGGVYTFTLRGKNIDLKKIAESLDLSAQIEGSAGVTFGGRITTGFTTLVRAGGRIQLKNLSVDKFHGQTAIIGNSPLEIETGNILFKIDDDEVYLMPGSSVSAPPDDKIYNFIAFMGTLWKIRRDAPNLEPEMLPEDLLRNNDDLYHLLVNGNISLRVLNGLLSGFGAVMDAGVSGDMSGENIASSFVQRYITGRIGTQYRAFDLDIAGKNYKELRINHLKFEGEGNFSEVDSTDWRRDSRQVKDFQRYSFNYGLPIGRDPRGDEKKKARQNRAAALKKREQAAAEKKTSLIDDEQKGLP